MLLLLSFPKGPLVQLTGFHEEHTKESAASVRTYQVIVWPTEKSFTQGSADGRPFWIRTKLARGAFVLSVVEIGSGCI